MQDFSFYDPFHNYYAPSPILDPIAIGHESCPVPLVVSQSLREGFGPTAPSAGLMLSCTYDEILPNLFWDDSSSESVHWKTRMTNSFSRVIRSYETRSLCQEVAKNHLKSVVNVQTTPRDHNAKT